MEHCSGGKRTSKLGRIEKRKEALSTFATGDFWCITNMKQGVYGRHVAPKQYERVDKPIFKLGREKKRNKNNIRSRLTPVGGISLNS